MSPFSASSTVPRQEGKNGAWEPFSLSFSNYFRIPLCGRPELDDQVGWASPSSFGLWARWMAFGPFFIHVLSTVDQWICWALDPWWITKILNLIHGGPKKWASTNTNDLTGIQMLSISKGINNKYVNCKNDLTISEVRIFKLLQWKVYPMVYKPLIWTHKITIFFFLISRRCHY